MNPLSLRVEKCLMIKPLILETLLMRLLHHSWIITSIHLKDVNRKSISFKEFGRDGFSFTCLTMVDWNARKLIGCIIIIFIVIKFCYVQSQ